MSAALTVRPATAADLPLIAALIGELAAYEKLAHEAVASEQDLRAHLFGEDPAAEVLIGEADGVACGFALYFRNFSTFAGKPGLYLEDLFVRPAQRGHGLGLALMRAVAREALRRGCARFEWAVLDWNTPSIDFYQALGARPMNDWTVFRIDGDALTALGAAGE